MKALNLDRDFNPCSLPKIDYSLFKFYGGEWQIKIDDPDSEEVIITTRLKNADDIMKLLLAKDAVDKFFPNKVYLIIPYIPYARQDRICEVGESLSIKVFSNLINSQKFNIVYVLDAHSNVSTALINNCINFSSELYVKKIINNYLKNNVILISPDAGAHKKVEKIAQGLRLPLVKCDKVRDTKTGNLSGFMVLSDNLNKQDCLIVDDICDGGGTFIGLAEELKNKNAGDLYLYTSHGIYSKGFRVFDKYFKRIFCTNSFYDIQDNLVTQFKIKIDV